MWNGHVVALVQNVVGNEADFVLISRAQWDPVAYDLALVEGVVQGDVGLVSGQRRRFGWSFPGRFQLH